MKAQLVKESIEFKRSGDSKKSLKVGQWSPQEIEKTIDEAVLKFAELGYSVHSAYRTSRYIHGTIAEIIIENKITAKSNSDNLNASSLSVLYVEYTEEYKKFLGDNIDKEIIIENGPWVMMDPMGISSEAGERQRTFYSFRNFEDLLKEFVKLDYEEAIKDWNWVEITKKRLALIES